jgi:hypothetical protein
MAFPTNFTPQSGGRYTMQGLQSGGSIRIRVMTDFIVGKSVWTNEGTVCRVREDDSIPEEKIGTDQSGKPNKVKQFIAAGVWNYDTNQFEIFETDKGSILGKLWDYDQDPDYGDCKNYDIKIGKTGAGLKTKYSVVAAPPKPLDEKIKADFRLETINPDALFEGKSPFSADEIPEDMDL